MNKFLCSLACTWMTLLPRSYQVSKEVVHELKFGDIAVMQILTICSRVTGILILIVNLGCLKEVKSMDMILRKCKFPNSFIPYFQYHML